MTYANKSSRISQPHDECCSYLEYRLYAASKQLKAEEYEINEDDLKHLSPARHEHINPYGKYEFNVEEELNRKCLRALRKG